MSTYDDLPDETERDQWAKPTEKLSAKEWLQLARQTLGCEDKTTDNNRRNKQ